VVVVVVTVDVEFQPHYFLGSASWFDGRTLGGCGGGYAVQLTPQANHGTTT